MPVPFPRDDNRVAGIDAAIARARLRGKRVALGLFIAVAVVFVGASATQIVRAVFGHALPSFLSTDPGAPDRLCAVGVASLLRALDRAGGVAQSVYASALDGDEAVSTFDRALGPEWDRKATVEQACTSPEGLESWAALLRLHEALAQEARRARIEVAPLRRDVIAHLPANLR